jgi:hypothetical protein
MLARSARAALLLILFGTVSLGCHYCHLAAWLSDLLSWEAPLKHNALSTVTLPIEQVLDSISNQLSPVAISPANFSVLMKVRDMEFIEPSYWFLARGYQAVQARTSEGHS